MANTDSIFALPTEPLLELPTKDLGSRGVDPKVRAWMLELLNTGDIHERGRVLYQSIRKRLLGATLVSTVEGLLAAAAEGDPEGLAGLSALICVQAPGVLVIEGVREFRNLHRMATRIAKKQGLGKVLAKEETELLKKLAAADSRFEDVFSAKFDLQGLPSPLDLGPARIPRRAFESIIEEFEARGTLEEERIEDFIGLAELEVISAEMRASGLAEGINPYSPHAVSSAMPILANLDTEIRDMSLFLAALTERKSAMLFHEQHPLIRDVLEEHEVNQIQLILESEPRLHLARRLITGLGRSPLPGRVLAYYADRLMSVGVILHAAKLRPKRIDPLEAVLLAQEFCGDMKVRVPVGKKVLEVMRHAGLDGVTVLEDEISIPFESSLARRVRAPQGLPAQPLPDILAPTLLEEEQADESIKELVVNNLNNTSVLLGLLKNQQVVSKPGIVCEVATRCRNARVLEVICTTRNLHSGFANKDVPLAILRSPARLPIKTVRKFVHVKYVSKVDLRRLSHDKSGLRREIYDEINEYLDSLT